MCHGHMVDSEPFSSELWTTFSQHSSKSVIVADMGNSPFPSRPLRTQREPSKASLTEPGFKYSVLTLRGL